jgi:glucosyl-dolichyl phosphate glucuronosyltransferase
MNNLPLITIAICTYNRAEYLRDTLHDLAAQAADLKSYEIIVINNNSSDHTVDVCRTFAAENGTHLFKAVNEEQQGLSHARNRAAAEAGSEFILYIDDDVRLPADFVSTALGYMEKYPDAPCAGGRIYVSFDGMEGKPDWIPGELMPMFGLHDLGDSDRIYPSNNFPRGGNMMIKKSLLTEQGMFEPGLGRKGEILLGSEEKHFFEKVRGHKVQLHYWAGLYLWHRIGESRLKAEYLRKQSAGIGRSERIRVQGNVGAFLIKLTGELVKLAGSLILSAGYLIRGKGKAAGFLLKFRVWVLRGFLSG